MEIEDLKKELEKQKDPLSYLKKLLKKTKDKNLIKKIKSIIEKLKNPQKRHPNLEHIIRNTPRIPVEEEPVIQRTITRATPAIPLEAPEKKQEDYGIKIGGADYGTSTEKIKKNLQQSHLISEHGFTSAAETKNLIEKKIGEYSTNKQLQEEQFEYAKFEHIQKDNTGLTSIEKEIQEKRKKTRLDYE